MTHDEKFAEFVAAKREREAATVKVTWRRVSADTGGGYSGLGPGGRLVYTRWVGPSNRRGEWEYGHIVGKLRLPAGTATLLINAQLQAAELFAQDPPRELLRCRSCGFVGRVFNGWAFTGSCCAPGVPSMLHDWEHVDLSEDAPSGASSNRPTRAGQPPKGRNNMANRSSRSSGTVDTPEPVAETPETPGTENVPAVEDVTGNTPEEAAPVKSDELVTALMRELGRKVVRQDKGGYLRLFKGSTSGKCVAWVHKRKGHIRVDARIQPDVLPAEMQSLVQPASGSYGVRVPVKSTEELPVAVEAINKALEAAKASS